MLDNTEKMPTESSSNSHQLPIIANYQFVLSQIIQLHALYLKQPLSSLIPYKLQSIVDVMQEIGRQLESYSLKYHQYIAILEQFKNLEQKRIDQLQQQQMKLKEKYDSKINVLTTKFNHMNEYIEQLEQLSQSRKSEASLGLFGSILTHDKVRNQMYRLLKVKDLLAISMVNYQAHQMFEKKFYKSYLKYILKVDSRSKKRQERLLQKISNHKPQLKHTAMRYIHTGRSPKKLFEGDIESTQRFEHKIEPIQHFKDLFMNVVSQDYLSYSYLQRMQRQKTNIMINSMIPQQKIPYTCGVLLRQLESVTQLMLFFYNMALDEPE